MKKVLLSIIALFGIIAGANAQSWKMVVTHEDGTNDTLSTSPVKQVSFAVEDQNVESVIIKELYNGGTPKNTGKGYFQWDKGFIMYNNSPEVAVLNNLCVGMGSPYNAEDLTNTWYKDGKLLYSDTIPLATAIWYFQQPIILQPYEQKVISMFGSIDNTKTYKYSVNYANPDYYCMYDPESGMDMTFMYPTPSDVIPTSHYLKAVLYGQATAWPLSVKSPAFIIFQIKGATPNEYANNADNYMYEPNKKHSKITRCLKVPADWIIDGVEEFNKAYVNDNSLKRLTSDIDAGRVVFTPRKGYSVYRNVNKAATEALPENEGKLVYNYDKAVEDENNGADVIDAEASMKNGAHIIYMDENNSTTDFHLRKQFSLRD